MSQVSPAPAPSQTLQAESRKSTLWTKSFLALWIGQLICFTGNNVYSLALMWEMKELTGSTVMMSTVSIATLVPMIVLGPLAGTLVDRWKKRMSMILSDIARWAVITVLTFILFTHHLAPWMLIAGAVINSAVGTVYTPANSAMLPLLVGREKLQKANSFVQGTQVLTGMIGPFVGGFLVAQVSMTAAFAVNAVAYLASVVSLLFVKPIEPNRTHAKLSARQLLIELKEGVDVIREIPLMKKLIPVALICNFLFAPFDLILIQFCTNTLHGGAELFGTVGTCFSAGMLGGAILSGALSKFIRKGHLMSVSFVMSTVMMIVMSFTRTIWITLTIAVMMGLFNMMLNILLNTTVQLQIPQDKMGRVFGTMGTLSQGAQPFAQAAAGFLLTAFTAPSLMVILGSLATVDALYGATRKELLEVA